MQVMLADALTPLEQIDLKVGVDDVAGRSPRKPTADQLNEASIFRTEQRDERAVKVAAGLLGSRATQNLIAVTEDFYRATRISGPDGREELWGATVRLVVAFEATDLKVEATLPVVAAMAQLGQVKAEYKLDVRGLRATPELAELWPAPGEFRVDTYVMLLKTLTAIQRLILSATDDIDPVLITFEMPDGGG